MRSIFFLAATLVFTAGAASAALWVTVQPDHANGLYSAGEKARLRFTVEAAPTEPGYALALSLQPEGVGPELAVPVAGGVGEFETSALAAGTRTFRVLVRLHGPAVPPDGAWDELVQDETLELRVVE